jgi:hypothetical protein
MLSKSQVATCNVIYFWSPHLGAEQSHWQMSQGEMRFKTSCHIALVMNQGPYLQHLIFFVTFVSAQYVRVLHYTRLDRLAMVKHSSLLGL